MYKQRKHREAFAFQQYLNFIQYCLCHSSLCVAFVYMVLRVSKKAKAGYCQKKKCNHLFLHIYQFIMVMVFNVYHISGYFHVNIYSALNFFIAADK